MTDLNKLNEAMMRGDLKEIWNTMVPHKSMQEDIYKTRCQEIVSPGVHCWKLHPCEDHEPKQEHEYDPMCTCTPCWKIHLDGAGSTE